MLKLQDLQRLINISPDFTMSAWSKSFQIGLECLVCGALFAYMLSSDKTFIASRQLHIALAFLFLLPYGRHFIPDAGGFEILHYCVLLSAGLIGGYCAFKWRERFDARCLLAVVSFPSILLGFDYCTYSMRELAPLIWESYLEYAMVLVGAYYAIAIAVSAFALANALRVNRSVPLAFIAVCVLLHSALWLSTAPRPI